MPVGAVGVTHTIYSMGSASVDFRALGLFSSSGSCGGLNSGIKSVQAWGLKLAVWRELGAEVSRADFRSWAQLHSQKMTKTMPEK